MYIVLLRGFAYSGKDYVGQILCNQYNYKRFAFADSLKKIVSNTFNCPLDILHSQEGKLQICETDTHKRTYRQILIDEALRLRNENINVFVEYCCKEIINSNHDEIPKNIVITDWRYQNEIKILNSSFPTYKIIPVHVIRSGQTESPVQDKSEYQLLNRQGDYILHNNMNSSIYEEIEKLLKTLNDNTHH
jgi:hypothetical protein